MAEAHQGNGSEPQSDELAGLRSLTSALLQRYQWASQHDLSFYDTSTGTWKRNLSTALGRASVLRPQHYRDRYERGGIAECIVEAYPNATWPLEMTFQEDEDPEIETEFERDCNALVKGHDLWSVFHRADVLKELGHYSVILIGAPGPLEEELPRLRGPEDIVYLQPYGENAAKIESLVGESGTDQDMANPRFGLPEYYQIRFGGSSEGSAQVAENHRRVNLVKRVHWSRIIHLSEGALETQLYGKPRLRAIWDLLDDLYKVTGGGAEAAFRNMDPKRIWGVDPEIKLSADQKTELADTIDDMRHGLKNDVRLQGVKAEQLTAVAQSFGPNAKSIIEQISATTGIPQRILMGSERGELASSQDSTNWEDRIDARWSRFGNKSVRDFANRLIEYGAVASPADGDYEIIRPSRDEPTDEMRASVTEKMARANQAQKAATGKPLFTSEQILDHVWDMEYLAEAEDFLQDPSGFLPEEDVGDPLTEPQERSRPN